MKRENAIGRFFFLAIGLAAAVACDASSDSASKPVAISPQPQPNRGALSITAPCTATSCGDAPASLAAPKCAPQPTGCEWKEDDVTSYAPCPEASCGTAPGADVCPAGTVFKGNQCGSENDAACAWSTACVPPPSTTPCPDANGCGLAQPAIGVVCKDGGTGELVCMQFDGRCDWQPSCD